MSWMRSKTMLLALMAILLAAGCATQAQYQNPSSQEESSRTNRELYPNPFTLDQGPSATSSGNE